MDDEELIKEVFRIIGCRNFVNEIAKRPTRLGIARTGRNRPLKVELRNEWTVDEILRNKKELMFSKHFYRVYINRDLSKEDRENEKNERQARRNNKFGDAASGAGSGGAGRRNQQRNGGVGVGIHRVGQQSGTENIPTSQAEDDENMQIDLECSFSNIQNQMDDQNQETQHQQQQQQ
ncbi:unnamed protein product, partial [Meganyctiphanes norvegica]